MATAPTFASAREAAETVRAGLGFLAAADATAMAAETQAQCLQILEPATAMSTAARASILAAFTSGQGYAADADYSPRAWLIITAPASPKAPPSPTAPGPQRRYPARQALPMGRKVQPARLGLPGPPRQAQEERRRDQRQGLRAAVLLSPPGGDRPVGLDSGPEPRRDDDRVEPR
jgi:hypothetical protein